MKYKLEHHSLKQALVIKIPDTLPAIGTSFEVEMGDEGTTLSKQKACLLADGLSLLIGTQVIRFRKKIYTRRQGHVRVDMGREGHSLVPTDVQLKIVRPVEPKRNAASLGGGDIKSPMTGKVLQVLVKEGDKVAEEQDILTIEAMKMENRIKSDCAGVIQKIRVQPGKTVSTGDVLFTLNPSESL